MTIQEYCDVLHAEIYDDMFLHSYVDDIWDVDELKPWAKTSDRLPTREDGPLVLIRQRGTFFTENNQDWDTSLKWWDEVVRACSPDAERRGVAKDWWWMPIPPLPEEEE